jgi:eukaryotic-like serine/threonine-protein kinase
MTRQTAAAETIADRYNVVARIASGGMGEVFRARDTVLGRIVAVKVLPAALAAKPGFVERFRAEAQAAASLSHPNVVQVHDWGDTGAMSYMVMEYVRGRNLREILGTYGNLAPRQACEVVVQALRALGAAHERGLVHRDIKPENILVTLDGIVKVADFGLARAAEGAATTDGLVGTVAYVAPEQVRGDAVDGRADLYAMGCVLYELLTGSQPFEGDPARVLHAHLHEDVPAPSLEQPEAGEELDRVVAKATASQPADRYMSAGQMLADLERALATVPSAPPISELTQELTSEVVAEAQDTMVPGRKRRRRVWKVLLTLLVIAGLGALGYLFRPVRVPNVLSDVRPLTFTEARRTLNFAGLEVEQRRVSSDAPKDLVVAVHPEVGKLVRHGRKILLDVSNGPPPPATVPLLRGRTETEAVTLLEQAGLVPAFKRTTDRARAGTVIDQSAEPDSALRPGTPVTLTISLGPELVDLADWKGHMFPEAEQALAVAGLTAVKTETFHDTPEGTILSQDPIGPKIEKGSPVNFVTSKGPEPFQIADYKGTACSAAKAELEAKGITVTVDGGACGQNKVIDQDRPPTATVKKGQTVILYV